MSTFTPQRKFPALITDSPRREFSALPSRSGVGPNSSAHRTDPFWDGVWDGVSSGNWVSAAQAERRGHKMPGHFSPDLNEAAARLRNRDQRLNKFRLCACVDSWRTLTVEQASAMIGFDRLGASGKGRIIGDMFATGILDVGVWPNLFSRTSPWSKTNTMLLRQGQSRGFDDIIKPGMTWAEWVSVTGGRGWTPGGQYDRHNVLGTELGLRLAEFTSVRTVVGEQHSRIRELSGLSDIHQRKAADLTAVRDDGVRIAVEITASNHGSLAPKIAWWVDTLRRARMDETGLVVLFLVAPSIDFDHHARDVARSAVFRGVSAALGETGKGTFGDTPVHERVFIADWTEWFPAARQASGEFIAGNAWQMANPDHPDPVQRWERRSLLGSKQTRAAGTYATYDLDPSLARSVEWTRTLAGMPWWLRSGRMPDGSEADDPPDVNVHLYAAKPAPERKRPDEPSVLDGWGIGTGTRPPARLRGIAPR